MKKEPSIKEFRHKAEMPLVILGYALTLLVAMGCIVAVLNGGEIKPWAQAGLLGLIMPVFALVFVRYLSTKEITNSIRVTEKQLPELYTMYKELANEMGFKDGTKDPIPKLYLKNGGGTLNAFASKCSLHKKYVVIHSDIVDIAYTHNNFGAVRFVLAHELAHAKCGHINLRRMMYAPLMRALFLQKSVVRAQEYTADRVAAYYTKDDVMGVVCLYSGKNLLNRIDVEEYIKTIDENDKGLFIKFINFMSDHAVGHRRSKALYDTKSKGWDVHGKML